MSYEESFTRDQAIAFARGCAQRAARYAEGRTESVHAARTAKSYADRAAKTRSLLDARGCAFVAALEAIEAAFYAGAEEAERERQHAMLAEFHSLP